MARRKKGRAINGIVLVDKPEGGSSNNILQKVRAIFNAQKAGHTGALDPLATGMLPICLGEATKYSQYLLDSDKSYFVTAKFGERTDTSDAEGEIVEVREVDITLDQINEFKETLTGPIKQVPTMFSALKHNGQPLYKLARQGITVERAARPITIYEFELLDFRGDEADFQVRCSKGTYIRTLVDDLGQLLGCGAHVKVLRRTQVANYPVDKMLTLDQIQKLKDDNFIDGNPENEVDYTELDSHLLPMQTALIGLPEIKLSTRAFEILRFGQTVPIDAAMVDLNADLFQQYSMKDEETEFTAYDSETAEFEGVVCFSQGHVKVKRLAVKTP
ncbi:tRNA pseudouridine(55) synthase TruB [Psychrosphaera haliotis]|uniref:tRNA pseudouridine synthase B n=1 Tax=Psychrosphaera haliotis TaxID=555083 RepID=A0A6N8F5V5_9GAMM|nr:tRNA pseudouridine(55) synthase TruB [Psychrosphaera haliotis]MUH71578.1 tRNA pseudouridine(55) synthase TruB [Psychrosphaera haliotis]